MYCCRCGVELPERAKYCMDCGAASSRAEPSAARRRLIRPRGNVKVAGVCAAFAEYFEVDVTVIRVLWLVLCIWPVPMFGVLAYFIAWFAIPREDLLAPPRPAQPPSETSTGLQSSTSH